MSTVEATLSTMMQRGPEHPGAAHLARRIVKGSAAIAAFPDDPAEHPLVEVGRARNDSRRHFDVTVFPFASVGDIGIPFPSAAILAASKLKSIPHRRAKRVEGFKTRCLRSCGRSSTMRSWWNSRRRWPGKTTGRDARARRKSDVESSRAWRGDSGKKVKSWK